MGNPVVNREPTEQEIAKHKQMIEKRKNEFIANFLTTLEADDFQKEIIKQNAYSYFDAKMALLKIRYEHSFSRDQALKKLDETHFKAALADYASRERRYGKTAEQLQAT